MRSSRGMVNRHFPSALFLSLALVVLCASTVTSAQQTANTAAGDRERGIQLYNQGDFSGATVALRIAVKRDKDDISAWHYLGLAFEQLGKKTDARKAHEKAAKVADTLLVNSINSPARPPKARLIEGAESADRYLALSVNPSQKKTAEWRDRADLLRRFADDAPPVGDVYSGKTVTTKARVLSRPEPAYTERARQNQITGTVTLRCVFSADGHVRSLHVVTGLPDGLTLRAIVAAQHKFVPATKDGRPVSIWMELQYNFNLY